MIKALYLSCLAFSVPALGCALYLSAADLLGSLGGGGVPWAVPAVGGASCLLIAELFWRRRGALKHQSRLYAALASCFAVFASCGLRVPAIHATGLPIPPLNLLLIVAVPSAFWILYKIASRGPSRRIRLAAASSAGVLVIAGILIVTGPPVSTIGIALAAASVWGSIVVPPALLLHALPRKVTA
ncbi:MAG: hypothetical protein O7A04_02110 [Acidobacteria bacterium]|nr:hypothetical protein [Acidobacteriota bacterium]